nr:hypothetical protein [Actinomycetota bacterium]
MDLSIELGVPPPAVPPAPAPVRDRVRSALAVAAGTALAGVPLGLLWAAAAPRAYARPGPDGGAVPVDPQTQAFFAADGLLFLLGLAAGVVAGLLGWRLARRGALEVLLALAVGSALAAVVTWQTGVRTDDRDAARAALREPGRTVPVEVPLRLRAHAALLG